MRYGYVVPNNLGIQDPQQLVALGVRAEELGFDSLWVNHHILHLGYVQERLGTKPYQDALVTLTWLAAQTSRVQVGTSVLVMPYLHPMALAKHLATLDQLSGRRLVVGVGAGSLPEENAVLGVPYATRGNYCNEFIQVLRGLWTQERFSFDGEYFSFSELDSSPKPQQQPLIVVGGNRPPALTRVARYADGWHPMNLSPEGVARRLQVIRNEALAIGRPQVPKVVQVRLDMERVGAESVAAYQAAGVTELVMHIALADAGQQQRALEEFAGRMLS